MMDFERRPRWAPAAVLAGVVWLCPAAVWAQGPVVGLLDGWGVAHPGAAFVDGEWRRLSGPSDFEPLRRVRTGPGDWTLLDARSGERRAIRLGAVIEFRDSYFEAWGVLTDFPPQEITANRRPTTVGVFFSGPGQWWGIETVSIPITWSPGVEARLRELHRDQASGGDSRQVYFVSPEWIYAESERFGTHPPLCPALEIIQAWLRHGEAGLELVGSRRTESECDRKGIEWFRPLASLELEGRMFVVGHVAAWESSGLGIIELSDDEPVRRLWPW